MTLFNIKKTPPGPHMNSEKRFRRIREETHVLIIVDYSDTMSASSLTTQTPCPLAVDYSDTLSVLSISTSMLTHGKLFFFLEEIKLMTNVTENVIWYFRKLRVSVVVSYADTCYNSCWLCRHDVGLVIYYVDMMSA